MDASFVNSRQQYWNPSTTLATSLAQFAGLSDAALQVQSLASRTEGAATYISNEAFMACNRSIRLPEVWCGGQKVVESMRLTAAFLIEQELLVSELPVGMHLAPQFTLAAYERSVPARYVNEALHQNLTIAFIT